jgi:hypothetical protein
VGRLAAAAAASLSISSGWGLPAWLLPLGWPWPSGARLGTVLASRGGPSHASAAVAARAVAAR